MNKLTTKQVADIATELCKALRDKIHNGEFTVSPKFSRDKNILTMMENLWEDYLDISVDIQESIMSVIESGYAGGCLSREDYLVYIEDEVSGQLIAKEDVDSMLIPYLNGESIETAMMESFMKSRMNYKNLEQDIREVYDGSIQTV